MVGDGVSHSWVLFSETTNGSHTSTFTPGPSHRGCICLEGPVRGPETLSSPLLSSRNSGNWVSRKHTLPPCFADNQRVTFYIWEEGTYRDLDAPSTPSSLKSGLPASLGVHPDKAPTLLSESPSSSSHPSQIPLTQFPSCKTLSPLLPSASWVHLISLPLGDGML